MSDVGTLVRRRFGETSRRDKWWVSPALTAFVFGSFVLYTTWAGMQGANYFYHEDGAHYLSPLYSPLLYGQEHEPRVFGAEVPPWWPSFIPFSPAFLILIGPAGVRITCYYYRGSLYKAFWADPPACAVGEPRKSYLGENSLPLIAQNLHRYFWYIAAVYILVLAYDAYKAYWFMGEDGANHFGLGFGSLVLTLNTILLGGYTFGCHCSRHVFFGHLKCFGKSLWKKKCYDCVSHLNRNHMKWAWCSLVWVGFTDLYVRMLASGVWSDWRIF